MFRKSILLLFAFSTLTGFSMHSLSALDSFSSNPGEARIMGLSGAYTAVTDDSNALFYNPAGLSELQNGNTKVQLDYEDAVTMNGLEIDNMDHFFSKPLITPKILYTAPNWGISLYSGYQSDIIDAEGSSSDEVVLDITKKNVLEAGFSFDLGSISLGLGFRSSKELNAESITLEKNISTENLYIELFQNVLLGDYSSQNGENEELMVSGGFLADLGSFSVGVYNDSLIDLISLTNEGDILNSFFKDINIGAAFRTRNYDDYGNIKLLRFLWALDIDNAALGIFEENEDPDKDQRKLQIGFETGLYFSEKANLAIRAGYSEPLPDYRDLLFGLNINEGTFSFGLGLNLLFTTFDVGVQVPPDAFVLLIDPEYDYTGEPVQGRITMGVSF
ncbi:MAG: hypothetical protein K9L24_01240 [Spirochaetia bacterium]|nr:hypothetical protein [Spirochaetia bacterium]MCF7946410.1 hypothetical protein [Spirochaetia bacterium]MCF7952518.1 hypothetical protein [Spirochaetales bacterium]